MSFRNCTDTELLLLKKVLPSIRTNNNKNTELNYKIDLLTLELNYKIDLLTLELQELDLDVDDIYATLQTFFNTINQ